MDLVTQLDLATRHIAAADQHRAGGSVVRALIHEISARSYLEATVETLRGRLEDARDADDEPQRPPCEVIPFRRRAG